MTTIAYKDGLLAADSRAVLNGAYPALVNKIKTIETGELKGSYYAYAGREDVGETVFQWLSQEEAATDPKTLHGVIEPSQMSFCAFVVTPKDVLFVISAPAFVPVRGDYPFMAIGSGGDFALAAMHLGKSAYEAVEIAIELDINSGGPVRSVNTRKINAPTSGKLRGRKHKR